MYVFINDIQLYGLYSSDPRQGPVMNLLDTVRFMIFWKSEAFLDATVASSAVRPICHIHRNIVNDNLSLVTTAIGWLTWRKIHSRQITRSRVFCHPLSL
jgi:hypothetical protein